MPLRLDDTFYLEAPLKVYLDHDIVKDDVTTDKNLAGTARTIVSSITLLDAGTWKIVGYGRFRHPVAGKYLYTWIDKEATWMTSTEWNSFLGDDSLRESFQAVTIENDNDYVDIHIGTIVTITTSTTFNWSFTTDDTSTGVFFDATTGSSSNALISAIIGNSKVENQAYFFAFKMSS